MAARSVRLVISAAVAVSLALPWRADAVPSYDARTGGGGFGPGHDGHDESSAPREAQQCLFTAGAMASLPCRGVIPEYDVVSDGLTATVTDGATVFTVASLDHRSFRELAVGFSHPVADSASTIAGSAAHALTFHLVDSADYATCADFALSPTGRALCAEKGFGADDCVAASECVRVSTGNGTKGWAGACAEACGLARSPTVHVDALRRRHVVASWDFSDGLEGWANATASEMEAEVYARGGELRGAVQGIKADAHVNGTWAGEGVTPHFDSPRLALTVDDRHHLVLRMLYSGPARTGRALFRTGSASMQDLGRTDHGLASWTNRPNATAVRWSQGSANAAHVTDGNVHTGWTAAADEDG